MSELSTALGAEVEAAALATPGVLSLYRSGSAVTKLVGAGVERLSQGDAALALVSVTERAGAVELEVSIGIAATAGALETTLLVRAQVEQIVVARGLANPLIRLTVVHISEGDAAAT